jgi:hypothetical protein
MSRPPIHGIEVAFSNLPLEMNLNAARPCPLWVKNGHVQGDVRLVPISAASYPWFVRSLSYMRELPTERAIAPGTNWRRMVLGVGYPNVSILTLDRRKHGHAF